MHPCSNRIEHLLLSQTPISPISRCNLEAHLYVGVHPHTSPHAHVGAVYYLVLVHAKLFMYVCVEG